MTDQVSDAARELEQRLRDCILHHSVDGHTRIYMSKIMELVTAYAQGAVKRAVPELSYKNTCNCEGDNHPCTACAKDEGYNEAIDHMKAMLSAAPNLKES